MSVRKIVSSLDKQREALDRHAKSMDAWSDKHVFPWLAGPFIVAAIHVLARLAAEFHWTIHIALTLTFVSLGFALLLGWRRKSFAKQHSSAEQFTLWLCTAFLLVEAFASISIFVVLAQPSAFTGPDPITRSALVDFYFYHFIEALPALKIWDTFQLTPVPMKQGSFFGGILLLVFRVGVLTTLAGALKDWISNASTVRNSPPTSAA